MIIIATEVDYPVRDSWGLKTLTSVLNIGFELVGVHQRSTRRMMKIVGARGRLLSLPVTQLSSVSVLIPQGMSVMRR